MHVDMLHQLNLKPYNTTSYVKTYRNFFFLGSARKDIFRSKIPAKHQRSNWLIEIKVHFLVSLRC